MKKPLPARTVNRIRLEVATLEDRRLPGESVGLFAMALGGPTIALMDHWLTAATRSEPAIVDPSQLRIAPVSEQSAVGANEVRDSGAVSSRLNSFNADVAVAPSHRQRAAQESDVAQTPNPVDLQSTPDAAAPLMGFGSVGTAGPASTAFGSDSAAGTGGLLTVAPASYPTMPSLSLAVANYDDLLSLGAAAGQNHQPVQRFSAIPPRRLPQHRIPPRTSTPTANTPLPPNGGVTPLIPPGGGGGGGGGTGGGDASTIVVEYRTRDPFA